MPRLASLLHASQKQTTGQLPKVTRNVPPTKAAGHGDSHSSSELDLSRSWLGVNELFYEDDLSFHGPSANRRIRLLVIEPSDHLSPVSCRFLNSHLQDHPEYDALSYCWGSQSQTQWCSVTIDNRQDFRVTKHLLQALRRLRTKDNIRIIWIDAICINQSNLTERNHQVQVMREIYSQARGVIIWLGEVDQTQPSCERHPSAFDREQGVCVEPGISAVEHRDFGRVLHEKLVADSETSRLQSRLGEAWWKSIWALQEFAASRSLPTVYLGPHAFRWQFFEGVLWGEDDHPFSGLRNERQSSLYGLLCTTYNSFYSTDPRDKAYALLGLIVQQEDNCITPDYAKSISEVYEDTMYHVLRAERTLDILFDKKTHRGSGHLPSWIPDLSQLKLRNETVSLDLFQASRQSQPEATLELETLDEQFQKQCACLTRRVLRLKGLYFDTVKHRVTRIGCTKYQRILQTPKVDWEAILDILLSPMTCDPPPLTDPRSRLDRPTSVAYLLLKYLWEGSMSIIATLDDEYRFIAKHLRSRLESPNRMAPRGIYRAITTLEKYTTSLGIKLTRALIVELQIAARAESDLLHKVSWGNYPGRSANVPVAMRDRTFFSTKYGFAGLGPADLQDGDHIVTFFGASRPFVLRNHGTHHILVGDAVVPGIMSGQMMVLFEDGSIQSEDFGLK